MNEEIKQRNRLSRMAVIDIYISGGNGRFYWPNRLQPYDESTPSVRRESNKYIIDSGFKNESGNDSTEAKSHIDTANGEQKKNRELTDFFKTTNSTKTSTNESSTDPSKKVRQELIDRVYDRRPDYVIPNDTVNTPDIKMRTAIKETAEKTCKFLNAIDDSFPATVLIPLQPPHDFHLAFLHEHYPRQANRGHYALGGMKHLSPKDQVRCIRNFRKVAGNDTYVHGFGIGASRILIDTLREEPHLLDSADFSNPQQHAKVAQIAGPSRKPVHVGRAEGTDSSTTTGAMMATELCIIARMLSPALTSDEDIKPSWDRLPFDKQTP